MEEQLLGKTLLFSAASPTSKNRDRYGRLIGNIITDQESRALASDTIRQKDYMKDRGVLPAMEYYIKSTGRQIEKNIIGLMAQIVHPESDDYKGLMEWASHVNEEIENLQDFNPSEPQEGSMGQRARAHFMELMSNPTILTGKLLESSPLMLSAIGGTALGGPALGVAMSSLTMSGTNYLDLRHAGVSHGDAMLWGNAAALGEAVIEQVSINRLRKIVRGQKTFLARRLPKSLAGPVIGGGATFLESGAVGATEETLQNIVNNAAAIGAGADNARGLFEGGVQAAVEGGVLEGVMGVGAQAMGINGLSTNEQVMLDIAEDKIQAVEAKNVEDMIRYQHELVDRSNASKDDKAKAHEALDGLLDKYINGEVVPLTPPSRYSEQDIIEAKELGLKVVQEDGQTVVYQEQEGPLEPGESRPVIPYDFVEGPGTEQESRTRFWAPIAEESPFERVHYEPKAGVWVNQDGEIIGDKDQLMKEMFPEASTSEILREQEKEARQGSTVAWLGEPEADAETGSQARGEIFYDSKSDTFNVEETTGLGFTAQIEEQVAESERRRKDKEGQMRQEDEAVPDNEGPLEQLLHQAESVASIRTSMEEMVRKDIASGKLENAEKALYDPEGTGEFSETAIRGIREMRMQRIAEGLGFRPTINQMLDENRADPDAVDEFLRQKMDAIEFRFDSVANEENPMNTGKNTEDQVSAEEGSALRLENGDEGRKGNIKPPPPKPRDYDNFSTDQEVNRELQKRADHILRTVLGAGKNIDKARADIRYVPEIDAFSIGGKFYKVVGGKRQAETISQRSVEDQLVMAEELGLIDAESIEEFVARVTKVPAKARRASALWKVQKEIKDIANKMAELDRASAELEAEVEGEIRGERKIQLESLQKDKERLQLELESLESRFIERQAELEAYEGTEGGTNGTYEEWEALKDMTEDEAFAKATEMGADGMTATQKFIDIVRNGTSDTLQNFISDEHAQMLWGPDGAFEKAVESISKNVGRAGGSTLVQTGESTEEAFSALEKALTRYISRYRVVATTADSSVQLPTEATFEQRSEEQNPFKQDKRGEIPDEAYVPEDNTQPDFGVMEEHSGPAHDEAMRRLEKNDYKDVPRKAEPRAKLPSPAKVLKGLKKELDAKSYERVEKVVTGNVAKLEKAFQKVMVYEPSNPHSNKKTGMVTRWFPKKDIGHLINASIASLRGRGVDVFSRELTDAEAQVLLESQIKKLDADTFKARWGKWAKDNAGLTGMEVARFVQEMDDIATSPDAPFTHASGLPTRYDKKWKQVEYTEKKKGKGGKWFKKKKKKWVVDTDKSKVVPNTITTQETVRPGALFDAEGKMRSRMAAKPAATTTLAEFAKTIAAKHKVQTVNPKALDKSKRAEAAKVDIVKFLSEINDIQLKHGIGFGGKKGYERFVDRMLGKADVRAFQIDRMTTNLERLIAKAVNEKVYKPFGENENLITAMFLAVDMRRHGGYINSKDAVKGNEAAIIELAEKINAEGLYTDVIAQIQELAKFTRLPAQELKLLERNVDDNYVPHNWDFDSMQAMESGRTAKTFKLGSHHMLDRTLRGGIVEGWARGYELEDRDFVAQLRKAHKAMNTAVTNVQMLQVGDRVGAFHFGEKKRPSGFVAARIPTKVGYDGNMSYTEFYTTPDIAKHLTNTFAESKLLGLPGMKVIDKVNYWLKRILLLGSAFHARAFVWSHAALPGVQGLNPASGFQKGQAAIEAQKQIILDGIEIGGLTLGAHIDISESKRKPGFLGKAEAVPQQLEHWLFERLGSNLKAHSFMVLTHAEINKNMQQLLDGTKSYEDILKAVARRVNNDFGGINYRREGKNPTIMHALKYVFLGHDWNYSNIRSMGDLFNFSNPDVQKMHAKLWGSIMSKYLAGWLVLNLAMAGLDDDDFVERLEGAWLDGGDNWAEKFMKVMDVNISPLAQAMGGSKDEETYINVMGHFKDLFKWTLRPMAGDPLTTVRSKQSRPAALVGDLMTGTDFWGKRFATKEQRKKQQARGSDWLKATTVKNPDVRGRVRSDELGSYWMHHFFGSLPIPAQEAFQWTWGASTMTETLGALSGADVSTAKKKDRLWKNK
jgi:hypothetical protein